MEMKWHPIVNGDLSGLELDTAYGGITCAWNM